MIDVVKGTVQKSNKERISVKQLGELLNIKNEEKIRQIVTIINESNINPNNGVSRSKLRILGENKVIEKV